MEMPNECHARAYATAQSTQSMKRLAGRAMTYEWVVLAYRRVGARGIEQADCPIKLELMQSDAFALGARRRSKSSSGNAFGEGAWLMDARNPVVRTRLPSDCAVDFGGPHQISSRKASPGREVLTQLTPFS